MVYRLTYSTFFCNDPLLPFSSLLFYSICLCTPSWNSTLLNCARCFHQWATTPIRNTRVTLSRRASLQDSIFHRAEKLGVALCSWLTANPHHYMRFFFLMIYSTKSVICSLKITHLDMNIFRTSQPSDVNATPRYSCYIRFASLDISCIIFFLIYLLSYNQVYQLNCTQIIALVPYILSLSNGWNRPCMFSCLPYIALIATTRLYIHVLYQCTNGWN